MHSTGCSLNPLHHAHITALHSICQSRMYIRAGTLDTWFIFSFLATQVKLMVDAEHTYYQPAIDHLSLELMRSYNKGGSAVIYNTYQAYLKDTLPRLKVDLERAKREGYVLGVKLVGAANTDRIVVAWLGAAVGRSMRLF